MIIDFAKMEDTVLHNFYGGELDTVAKMYLDENHRIMFDTLAPGASIGFHKHENSDEVIYVLEGEGKALYNDTVERVYPGQSHYCPRNEHHSLINDGDVPLRFFAVVTYYK
jgi:mannose-6-phosphate isomerase-like protein (cupin superfamily)